MIKGVEYSDLEIRLAMLPIAAKLVDQEFYRGANQCNTNSIAAIVSELVNIVRHGAVKDPAEEPQVTLDSAPATTAEPTVVDGTKNLQVYS